MLSWQKILVVFLATLAAWSCDSETSEVIDVAEPLPLLPRFVITESDNITFKQKKDCKIAFIDVSGDTVFGPATSGAKFRGGFTVRFPKRSYTIKLPEYHALLGMNSNDDWMLISNHNDKSFLRHKISYDLFTAFSDSNVAPQTAFVELYLEDSYEGIYVLTEKMGKSKLRLELADTNACSFKDPPVFRDPQYPDIDNQQPEDNWFHQKHPKTDVLNKNHLLYDLRDFIHTSTDEEFSDTISGIPSIFDLDNIIDWHILLLVTNNGDGIFKNFYLYRPHSGVGFRITPWDYDHTFGRDGDSELNLENKSKILNNALLRRLLETNAAGYKDRLKSRYLELQARGILTEKYMEEVISQHTETLRPSLQQNATRWPLDADVYYDDASNEEDWELIQEWWKNHLNYVTTYMNSL